MDTKWTVEQELAAQVRDRAMRDDYWASAGLPVDVMNLAQGSVSTYVGISPRQAVIAAYAQSKGDFNTWDYAKYERLVESGGGLHGQEHPTPAVYLIGDFSAFADGRRIKS